MIIRNISIGIPLNLSIPTEMGYIQPLVENENSAKLQNCVILTCVRSFLANRHFQLNPILIWEFEMVVRLIFLRDIVKDYI